MSAPQTVLLIDDSDVDCATYERFLRRDDRHDYQIVAFGTGEAALDWCQSHVADVILLDYQLPLMDGLVFLRTLRQQHPEALLPVILLTGVGNTAIAVEALKLGAQDYIEKAQVTKESLPPLVRSVIREVQLKRQVTRQQAQQQLVLELALQMRQSFEPQQALDAATQSSRQWLQCDRVLIYQFASDWSGAIVSEAIGTGWSSTLGQQFQDTCFQQGAGLAYLQGHTWAMSDIAQARLTDCHRELLQRFAVKANLVVPILQTASIQAAESKPALWGLLIAHHCANTHDWESDEIAFLQQVAVHLLGSLQQATLYQQAQTELVERKQAELALRESKTRLQLAQAASNCGVWDWDLVTNAIIWSPEYYALYRLDPNIEPNYDTWLSCIHPDDRTHTNQQTLQALIVDRPEFRIEFRVQHSDEIRWIASIGQIFHNAAGKPIRFIGISIDITPQKQTELALQILNAELEQRVAGRTIELTIANDRLLHSLSEIQQSKQEIEDLYDNSPCGYHSLDGDGRILRMNQTELQWLGYTRDEILHMEFVDLLTAESQTVFDNNFPKFKQQGWIHNLEFQLQHRDGSTRWVNLSATAINDESGRFIMSRSSMFDISDRKRAEAALQASETRYRSVITAMAEGVVLQQSDGTITTFNAAAERILGLTADQMTGKTSVALDWRTIHEDGSPFPGDTHPAMITLKTGQPQAQVIMGIRKGADTTWIAINAQPLFQAEATLPYAVVTSFADITALKQADLALQHEVRQRQLRWQIAQTIRESLELNIILQTTVMQLKQLLEVDRAAIYHFNPDWSGTFIVEAVAPAWIKLVNADVPPVWEDTYLQETGGGRFQQQKTCVAVDIYTAGLQPCHIALLEQFQAKAYMATPIFLGKNLWGLLALYQNTAARDWQAWEVDLLEQTADQVAIAIQQAELYQQVQTLNSSLEEQVQSRTAQLQQALDFEALLKHITDRLRDSLDEQYILQTAVEALAQGLFLEACDTGLYNAAQTTSTIAYECTRSLAALQGQTFALATAPHAEIYPFLLGGQTCHFCDVAPNPLRSDQRLLTTLAVPLADDQRVLGDLWLFKPTEAVFTDREIRLVQQVANQCAIALRQSRLYQAAQSQVQELARLNQLKDDFLSTVSHELRSPMSNIKMATQMLEISLHRLGLLEDASQSLYRYFNILRTEGQREITLINDLLDLTRLDAGTEPLRLSPIDLQYYLPHLAETFSECTQQQQQHLVLHVPDHLPPLTTDLPYLERLLTELLHNACKYTPPGETITLSAQAKANGLELCISNTGVEISPTERERIFDKFYRIPNHDPWKHGGTGLGLALVQKLTARLGGQISVDSGGGQTTFRLELRVPPLEVVAATTPPSCSDLQS